MKHHFLSILLCNSTVLAADTYTWNGKDNNNWDKGANWHDLHGTGGYPDSSVDDVLFKGDVADRSDADLRGESWTIGDLEFRDQHTRDFTIRDSTSSGSKLTVRSISNFGARDHVFEVDVALSGSSTCFAGKEDNGDLGSITINGIFSGSGQLNVISGQPVISTNPPLGPAYLNLNNGANTFNGTLNVYEGGIIRTGHINALQYAVVQVGDTVGAAFDFTTNTFGAKIAALTGTGTVDLGGANLTLNNPQGHQFNGTLTGDGVFNKNGNGDYSLAGANTFSGTTVINNGRLILDHTEAVVTSDVWIAGGSLVPNLENAKISKLLGSGGIDLGSHSLRIGENNQSSTFNGTITGNGGSIVKVGTGTLVLNGTSDYSGGTLIESGRLQISSDDHLGASEGPLTFSPFTRLTTDASLTMNRSIDFATTSSNGIIETATHNVILAGDLLGATGNILQKQGTGTLRYNGGNQFPGTINIQDGTFIANLDSLSATAVQISAGGSLDLLSDNSATSLGSLIGSGSLNVGSQTLTLGGDNRSNSFTGSLTGNATIVKTGSGIQSLASAQGYTGIVDINEGALRLTSATALQSATVRIYTDDGLRVNNHDAVLGHLAGNRNLALGTRSLNLGGNNSDRYYSGIISGSGSVTKSGTGHWDLNNDQAFSGPLNVTAGTLKGNGSVAGNLLVSSGAILSPGGSLGSFSVGGDLILSGRYLCEIDGSQSDQLEITGNLDLTNATLDFSELSPLSDGSYPIARYGSRTGTFVSVQNLPSDCSLDYAYNDGGSGLTIALIKDTTAPTLNSITMSPGQDNPRTGDTLSLDLLFSEEVAIEITDLALTFPGSLSTPTLAVNGSKVTLSVTVLSGSGSFSLALTPEHAIADLAENPVQGPSPDFGIYINNYYEDWAMEKGLTAGINDGPLDDPDGDGSVNLQEFAFDGDPLSNASAQKTRTAVLNDAETEYLSITLPVRDTITFAGSPSPTGSADGLSYSIQGTHNLTDFSEPVIEVTPADDTGMPPLAPGWSYHTFRHVVPMADQPGSFLRVGLEENF